MAMLGAASIRSRIATGPEAVERWHRLGDRVEAAADEDDGVEPDAAVPPRCVRHGGMSLHADVVVIGREIFSPQSHPVFRHDRTTAHGDNGLTADHLSRRRWIDADSKDDRIGHAAHGRGVEGSMRLQNKVAVITGGASGMGLASAQRFLSEGAQVVIADYNGETGEAATKAAVAQGYGDAISFIRTEVAREEDVVAMLKHAIDRFGRLDVVFNNAGVGGAIGPLTETSVEDWDYTFDVLAKGVFLGIKHAARILRAQGTGGSIINTASVAGLSGDAGPLVYSAAKSAVISITMSAAVELAPDRIRVNAICPGFIVTPMVAGRDLEKTRAEFAKQQPWPDSGQGDHIAGAALFFASDDSTFVTGEKLLVDGGLTAAGPELSKFSPRASAREMKIAGITKGSTGAAPEIRKL